MENLYSVMGRSVVTIHLAKNERIIYFLFCYIMRRKKPIEGLVVDLVDLLSEDIDIEALILAAEEKKKEKPYHVTDEEIFTSIRSYRKCDNCERDLYIQSPMWRGRTLCYSCHKEAKMSISADLSACITEAYSRGCAFCEVKIGRFHLDHVNMFSKEKSVCDMIDEGYPDEDIKKEIAKCQLLCINCHTLVTKFEHLRGFIKKKKYLNKHITAGEDVTDLRRTLSAEYEEVMTNVYPLIRERVSRGQIRELS